MNVLVTGGAGFIGSHTVDALVRAGNAVTVVDDLSTGVRANVNDEAVLEQLDVRDPVALDGVVQRARPDVIMAFAGRVDVRRSIADPMQDASTNVLGSLNTFCAGAKHGATRLIFASTGGALYGETRIPADERTPVQPLSPYGVAKYAAEQYLAWVGCHFGVTCTTLRYANVYGPRQNASQEAGVVALFLRRMLDGDPLVIRGNGLQTRDFVYVGDVVRANLLAMASSGGTYNIGTGASTSIEHLAALCVALHGSDVPVQHGPEVEGEVRDSVLDARLAADQLGWRPRWALEEGLSETLQWYAGQSESGRHA
jgi:UDP-glucose 4-epimerase